jgi:DNA-binding NarL/FixJ family response regulator
MTTTITVVLANRPRLFRELLQHALNTESARFRVIEATDGTPTPAVLGEADWVVVDEESAAEAAKMAAAHPHLGILALEGRGSRARVLAPAAHANWQQASDVPTLAILFDLLSQVPSRQAR